MLPGAMLNSSSAKNAVLNAAGDAASYQASRVGPTVQARTMTPRSRRPPW